MAFGDLNDPATIAVTLLVVIIAVIASATVLYAMRKRQKKPKKLAENTEAEKLKDLPFRISRSVQTNDASSAKDELRILELERDILSDALRRLYEAHAEGKISEQERDRLAATYKTRMSTVKDSIAKDETIVALHELEGMQEDLMKLFSERFGELTSKVEELRTRIDVKPIKEIKVQMPTTQRETEAETAEEEESAEEGETEPGKPKKKRKPAEEKPTAKTEAEKRIDEIRGEVEKVLDRLGQMEVET